MRYSFNLRYLKTTVKPKILCEFNFKRKAYFLIRLVYQVLINNMNFVYIDETKIPLKNSNLRIWRQKFDSYNYSFIK